LGVFRCVGCRDPVPVLCAARSGKNRKGREREGPTPVKREQAAPVIRAMCLGALPNPVMEQ
jgi:hypothetical protein